MACPDNNLKLKMQNSAQSSNFTLINLKFSKCTENCETKQKKLSNFFDSHYIEIGYMSEFPDFSKFGQRPTLKFIETA